MAALARVLSQGRDDIAEGQQIRVDAYPLKQENINIDIHSCNGDTEWQNKNKNLLIVFSTRQGQNSWNPIKKYFDPPYNPKTL